MVHNCNNEKYVTLLKLLINNEFDYQYAKNVYYGNIKITTVLLKAIAGNSYLQSGIVIIIMY